MMAEMRMTTQPNALRKWGYFFGISFLIQTILCIVLMVSTLQAIEREEKLQADFIADANQGDLMSRRDRYLFDVAASRALTRRRKEELTVLVILATVCFVTGLVAILITSVPRQAEATREG